MSTETIGCDFVLSVARQICSQAASAETPYVESRIDEKGVLISLFVAKEDLGRMVGKKGATAQALRSLLRTLGAKYDARYSLKIEEARG